jgi:polysaccharide biosynthesis/export protein
MRFLSYLLALFILIGLSSCLGQRRVTQQNYLEKVPDTSGKEGALFPETVIQKNDLLSIQVYSASIRPEVDAPYNLPTGTSTTPAAQNGFLVNARGEIEYPRLGTIKVEGLTKTQLSDLIKQKLQGQLTDPSVIIRFINYRVTVLGEVNAPGTFTVPTERLTIFEALGLAGDITEFGKKNRVKVHRENNGQRETGVVDLTSKDLFNSPYYNLQQNDVVLVEQTGERTRQREQQRIASQISIAATIVTTIALIISLTK